MSDIRNKDLTYRRVLTIALPIVISNATIPLLGIVDTAVVGQMGEAAPIGAVGLGAIILSSVYWIFGFLRMGTTGMAAQAIGANDKAETDALLVRALLIGMVAGAVLFLGQTLLFKGAFWVSPGSAAVESLAQDYLHIRIFSAPAFIALYGVTGWLIAKERTGAVLILQVWMNGLNILLDFWFVLHLGWGVKGVAFATVIAELSAFGIGIWMVRDVLRGVGAKSWSNIFNRTKLMAMAIVNRDILIRSVFVQAGFTTFVFTGSSFDDVTLAANQILLQFLFVTSYAMDGFALAAETLVGQAYGARDKRRFERAVWVTSVWGVISVIGYALCFYVFGSWIISMMAKSQDVQASAEVYLPWMVLGPLAGAASWMLDGIFIGATRGRDMRNMMVVSFAIYAVALWALVPALGNHGLWASLMIFLAVRGVTLAFRYPSLLASVR